MMSLRIVSGSEESSTKFVLSCVLSFVKINQTQRTINFVGWVFFHATQSKLTVKYAKMEQVVLNESDFKLQRWRSLNELSSFIPGLAPTAFR